MSEDSDFNKDFEEYESRSYETSTSSELEKLRARSKNACIAGCLLMMSPIVFIVMLLILAPSGFDSIFILLFIITFILMFVGIVILGVYGVGSNSLVRAYQILQRLGPPEPQLNRRFVVKQYDDVYIVGHATSAMLYFVAFRNQAGLTSALKLDIPKAIWRWEKRIEVSDMKLFRREGIFSVPTESGDFITGEGVLYAEAYLPSRYNWVVPEFNKDELLTIIKRVSEDAMDSSYGEDQI